MATFDEFYAAMNPDAGVRGNEFEQKFLPWLCKDFPHHCGRDCGDIIDSDFDMVINPPISDLIVIQGGKVT